MGKMQKEVVPVEAVEEQKPVVEDVAAEAKAAVMHESEVAAIKDSRARNLPLFRVVNEECELWNLLNEAARFFDENTEIYQRISRALEDRIFGWVVAVSEHQAKMALVDRVYPMEKVSKKDRDYRYLHLLEIAVKDAATT